MASFLGIFKKEVIGSDSPYMTRIHLTPWSWWKLPVCFYIHIFHRPDAEPHLHDHPRHIKSFIISGGYVEERGYLLLKTNPDGSVKLPSEFTFHKKKFTRKAGEWVDIPLETKHRVVQLLKVPTISFLIMSRKKKRTWGFWVDVSECVSFISAQRYFENTP